MCAQLKRLLRPTAGLRWRLLDALKAEILTSPKDWESRTLADMPALANQLAPTTFLPSEQIWHTLMAHTKELVAHGDAAQMEGVLVALLSQLVAPTVGAANVGHA
ncbi:hypothetical protein [Synechococcus sp. CS-1332]|uniref:hypothetical protein n=1 Tax=Synechococcus sp. CS-1332 TaxID=2847972 RepID=UPI00223C4757|nr:hypothetical protein [Synechococcus sp. CS-1332]MCT0208451.1 hypothetical protein [Synechococcus sp. CS-1332]